VIIFCLLVAATGGIGWVVYDRQARQLRREAGTALTAVWRLQGDGVANWYADELLDARLLASDAGTIEFVRGSRVAGGEGVRPPATRATLALFRRSHDIESITLVNRSLDALLTTPARAAGLTGRETRLAGRAMHTGEVVFSGIYRTESGELLMTFAAPVADAASWPASAAGAVVIREDADDVLLPLVTDWPASIPTGETVLATRDGGRVVFVSRVRTEGVEPLGLSLPLGRADVLAVRAARGAIGVHEGSDYRGEPVLGAVGPVPGTPWYLVAKEDVGAVESTIRSSALATVAGVIAIALMVLLALLLAWRVRASRSLRALVESERERSRLEGRYEVLMREAGEIVILLDAEGRIVEANDQALAAYGYARSDFVGRSVDLYRVPQGAVSAADRRAQLDEAEGRLAYESVHRRSDGVEFPVEVTRTRFEFEGEDYVLQIVRDIGERKAATMALHESEARYRTLFEDSISGFALHEMVFDDDGRPVDYVFLAANPAFEQQSGLAVADVLGKRVSEVIPGFAGAGLLDRFGRVVLTGEPERFEAFVPSLRRHLDIQAVSQGDGRFATLFVDVSQRRAAEEIVSGFFGRSPVGLFIVDRDLRYVRVNAMLAELNGLAPEDHVGRRVTDVVPMSDGAVERHVSHVIDTGEELRDADVSGPPSGPGGESRHLHMTYFPIGEREGRVQFVGGVAVDVTERRRAAAALRELSQRLEAVVTAAPVAIVVLDADTTVRLWNPAAAAIFGWSAAAVLGRPAPFIPADAARQAGELRDRVARGEQFAGVDLPCVRKDGSRFATSTSLALLEGADGESSSVLLLAEDVSDRRADALRLARLTRLYQVLSSVAEAIPRVREPGRLYDELCRIVVEQGGFLMGWVGAADDEGIVRLITSSGADEGFAEAMRLDTGVPVTDLATMGVALREGRTDTCADVFADARLGSFMADAASRGFRSCASVPILVDGRPQAALAIYSDEMGAFDDEEVGLLERLASDVAFAVEAAAREEARRGAERELAAFNEDLERRVEVRTGELAAANAELEAFSYSVSHDLRAPLRALDGFSLALVEDHGDRLDGTALDYLGRIRGAAQRMAGLIDDLLQLSRVTRRELKCEPVDLTAMGEDIIADLRAADPERQVEVTIAEGMRVDGDAHLLRVALQNLLANAWKFTSAEASAHIELGSSVAADEVVFFVRDDGAGFDPAYADKLFVPFQRLHGDDEFPGTGIGLATVQRVVRRHGGRVWASGEPGKGAIIRFTLGLRGEYS